MSFHSPFNHLRRLRPRLNLVTVAVSVAIVAVCISVDHGYPLFLAGEYTLQGIGGTYQDSGSYDAVVDLFRANGIHHVSSCDLGVCGFAVERGDYLCAISLLQSAKRRGEIKDFDFSVEYGWGQWSRSDDPQARQPRFW